MICKQQLYWWPVSHNLISVCALTEEVSFLFAWFPARANLRNSCRFMPRQLKTKDCWELLYGWEFVVTHALNTQEHLIENEVAVLRRVKHPNIIMLIEEVDTPTDLYLVMELVKVLFVSHLLYGLIQFIHLSTLHTCTCSYHTAVCCIFKDNIK